MQELVLTQPIRSLEADAAREVAKSRKQRAFESCLAECGPLAFRIAQGVLRNVADAEDVAQEAPLRAYQKFDRLQDHQRFRAWLVRISFRLALPPIPSPHYSRSSGRSEFSKLGNSCMDSCGCTRSACVFAQRAFSLENRSDLCCSSCVAFAPAANPIGAPTVRDGCVKRVACAGFSKERTCSREAPPCFSVACSSGPIAISAARR
jgi:Sigma-70 region 2